MLSEMQKNNGCFLLNMILDLRVVLIQITDHIHTVSEVGGLSYFFFLFYCHTLTDKF